VVVKLLSENWGYVNGMLWLRERLPLESGERESAPIWRIQTGVLLCTPLWRMGQARCWRDYSGIERWFPTFYTGDCQLRIGECSLCRIFLCARWNSLSFHMSNHCRHQACYVFNLRLDRNTSITHCQYCWYLSVLIRDNLRSVTILRTYLDAIIMKSN
jgi:hypothetical protein